MTKEKHRFLFFKYVPEKKAAKPQKEDLLVPVAEEKLPAEEVVEEAAAPDQNVIKEPETEGLPGWKKPDCTDEEYPADEECGECPGDSYEDECPGDSYEDECPHDPDYPDLPECPSEPEEPECPEPEPEPEPGPCPENHVMHIIQRGDTYWKLARKYGTTVEAIEAANPGVNPLNLQIGQEICIPLGIPGAKG